MASDYVDDFLRDERESFKRKETAAKKFDNRLDNFRKSAQALRDAAVRAGPALRSAVAVYPDCALVEAPHPVLRQPLFLAMAEDINGLV